MHIALRIVQIILALAFTYSGLSKLFLPREKLMRLGQTGIDGLSYPLIRTIALLELAGVAALFIPLLTGKLMVLTPLAAGGFCIIMILAARIHSRRKEWSAVGLNIFLLACSMFVAYGGSGRL